MCVCQLLQNDLDWFPKWRSQKKISPNFNLVACSFNSSTNWKLHSDCWCITYNGMMEITHQWFNVTFWFPQLEVTNNLWVRVTPNYPQKSHDRRLASHWICPKDHWTLKTGYFEEPTPAIQVQTLPLEGPRSLWWWVFFCQVWLWFFETKHPQKCRRSGFLDRMTFSSFLGLIGQESLNYPFRGDSNNANLSWFFRNLPL